MSFLAQRKRSALVQDVVRFDNPVALNDMSWLEFEQMVGEVFRLKGFHVQETGGAADGGVDLVLTRNGGTYLVQCKQWKDYKVGVKVVRELKGVMAAQRAAGGLVVTSGQFTQEAVDFAAAAGIQLLDGPKLFSLSQQVRRESTQVTDTRHAPSPMVRTNSPPRQSPLCPRCGETMTRRRAKQGKTEGEYFWGCSTYPNCRGTRAME